MKPRANSITPAQAQEQRLLEAALALGTESERGAFIAAIADPATRQRLEELVAASAEADSFFGTPPIQNVGAEILAPTVSVPIPPAEAPAQVLGRYKLLEKIGEGGFGEVWMAEQREPVKRRVALKIIKLGMDSRQIVARFEAERQALAMMDHANIAKIFDADVTDTGRPYFVMELVRGIKITEYCDQNQLPTKERLGLFIKVCQAIQHAHQKGIIHRDIKPSNILVTLHDGVPVPKVIDFGIAKATQGELTDKTVFTQFHQFIGTPAYISPEQAEMSGLDIDTRSDIYSLGVLLYELLVGQTPFDAREMMQGGLDALVRIIREREPMRPSTKLNTMTNDARTTAGKRRQTDVGKLVHQLQGDLDWIVMKCLEKDRTRRYDTANGLAMDLQRHLANEPVVARPPSTAYKIHKAWQRHKLVFSAASAVALALVAGISFSTWQAVRAKRAEGQKDGLLVAATKATVNEEKQRRLAEGNAAQARAAVTRLEIDRAEALFEKGQASEALAYLARVVRREPTNRVAGERIISALAHRNFCVPLFRIDPKGGVTMAEFSPEGQRVLIVSKEDGARIRDGRTGQPLLGPFAHAGEVFAACFSSDGTRVATASEDKTARIWDAQTGQPVTAPLQHESGVRSAGFSPDGKRLATGSADGSLRQWNAATGTPLGTNKTFEGGVNFVKYSPDGQWILLAISPPTPSRYRTNHLVNVTDGTVITLLEDGPIFGTLPSFSRDGTRLVLSPEIGFLEILGPDFSSTNRNVVRIDKFEIECARFSPDGQYVATSSHDDFATLRDVETLKPVGEKMRHDNWVGPIDFSPNGQCIATGSKDHTVRIWEARTGRPLSEPLPHDAVVRSVQFSADGQRILSVCAGGGVWVWEIRSAQPLAAVLQHPYEVRKAMFSPDGEQAATVTLGKRAKDCLVRLWDVPRATPLFSPLGAGSYDVQFSRDGRLLLGSMTGKVTVWDSSSGKVVGRPFGGARSTYARFSPDGQRVVIGGPNDSTVQNPNFVNVWRVADGERVARLSHDGPAGFARFSPDGRWVVSTSLDKTARLWDWQTGKQMTEPLRHEGTVVWADVSPDSSRVLTLSTDQTARIWEASSGRLLHTLSHGGEPYYHTSAEFSVDGRRLVIASGSAVQIWDAHTGQPVTAALTHAGRINSVKFSPDGTRLLTACNDGIARLWDAATGHSLSEPLRHLGRVSHAEFGPDGRRVITASQDGTARIFEVPALPASVPAWLADWAETVAGQRLDERNASQPVPFAELHRLRQSLAQAPETDAATRWAKWFFAENATRRISPGSSLAVPQLVQQRIEDDTVESLQQAIQLSPTNGLALARLAFLTLTNMATPDPRLVAALDWQSRHGVELSPEEPKAWGARAKFLHHLGRKAEAIDATNRATVLSQTNASFRNGRAFLPEETKRLETAR